MGISCSHDQKRDKFSLDADYVRAVARAGGLAVILPHVGYEGNTSGPDAVLRRLDGLILAGGGDVAPELFGEAPHPRLGMVDETRDRFEIALARRARVRGIPLLGICRGIQVINVAFGGTLVQDIPSEIGSRASHRAPEGKGRDEPGHAIRVEEGTWLSGTLRSGGRGRLGDQDERLIWVNSFHHQAVRNLAEGFRVSARCPEDGVIEAIEAGGGWFCLGIQWHPEAMPHSDEACGLIFRGFIAEARRYALS